MTIEEFGREIGKVVAELRNPVPALKLLGLLGVRAVQRNFDEQQSPEGTPWAPLKHARKRGARSAAKVLVDTGAMRNGITFDLPGSSSVRVGASALTRSRNAIHNFGGRAGRNGSAVIPERRYMGISDQAKAEIQGALRAQVLRLMKGR